MKLYKNDFVAKLAETADITKMDAEYVYDNFLKTLTNCLLEGDEVVFRGFGIFSVVEFKDREGISPKDKSSILIPKHRKLKFKGGKTIRTLLNASEED